MGSNCSPWQKGNVAARVAIVREVLASLRGGKGGRLNVTGLAESICRTIRAVEIREAESLGKNTSLFIVRRYCAPTVVIDHS